MKVLMLGWEFPPYISGGLGTACYGLTRGLDRLGTEVLFVLPRPVDRSHATHVKLLMPAAATGTRVRTQTGAEAIIGPAGEIIELPSGEFAHTRFRAVASAIRPYAQPAILAGQREGGAAPRTGGDDGGVATALGTAEGTPVQRPWFDQPGMGPGDHYAGDLFGAVERYAAQVCLLARHEQFDVIHAHDWMTYPAGMAISRMTGRPLIAHVHSTEFDRSGPHVNQRVYDTERAGMHAATRVVCVSFLTRNIIVSRYAIDPRKVEVVYNAIDDVDDRPPRELPPITEDEKIVLFLGRITMQKGPEYFLAAAKRVLEIMENVRFVMAGSGDMIRHMIELAAQMGIGHKVLFTGFLRGDDVRRVYQMADLYVMPSVSEPFGLTPLEALAHDVPVIISKQSGVAEVLTHALKVDFWDIDEMANKIVAVLRHPPLHATLRSHGRIEVRSFSWMDSAAQCVRVYEQATGRA